MVVAFYRKRAVGIETTSYEVREKRPVITFIRFSPRQEETRTEAERLASEAEVQEILLDLRLLGLDAGRPALRGGED